MSNLLTDNIVDIDDLPEDILAQRIAIQQQNKATIRLLLQDLKSRIAVLFNFGITWPHNDNPLETLRGHYDFGRITYDHFLSDLRDYPGETLGSNMVNELQRSVQYADDLISKIVDAES